VLCHPGFEPQQRQEILFFSKLSRLALEHTQPFLHGLKQPGHEGTHLEKDNLVLLSLSEILFHK
jgi:hypothetical protein